MRVVILTHAVASRLPAQISTTRRNNIIIEKRKLNVVRSAQAREERSLRPPPRPQKTTMLTDTRTSSPSRPLMKEDASASNPSVWQPMSPKYAVILLSVATLGFSFLATDLIFWHNLRFLDVGVHLFIKSHVSLDLHDLARHTMSNSPIVLGWCGWVAAAAAVLYKSNKKSSNEDDSSVSSAQRHFLISVAVYCLGGGTILHGDPYLVQVIKEVFQRSRPIENYSTYAFPSGHTTSASFVLGTLLYIIVPALLEAYNVPQQRTGSIGNNTTKNSSTRSAKISIINDKVENNVATTALNAVQKNRIFFWILCTAITASGRVVADVHWSTDVMAGACLGTGLVALTVLLCGISDVIVSGEERK
jgi:membrane-associated phospholipid phosphatase